MRLTNILIVRVYLVQESQGSRYEQADATEVKGARVKVRARLAYIIPNPNLISTYLLA